MEGNVKPKYYHPKIILIDIDKSAENALNTIGFNALSGSYGAPYAVTSSHKFVPVQHSAYLPNFTEQEIVIIDLAGPKPASPPDQVDYVTSDEKMWWQKCSAGQIDPRPLCMAQWQKNAVRILDHGGVFIVFANTVDTVEYTYGRVEPGHGLVSYSDDNASNWSFLPLIQSSEIEVKFDHGEEISLVEDKNELRRLLEPYFADASFTCTMDKSYRLEGDWVPLAKNKYGKTVSAFIRRPESNGVNGWVFMFPRLTDTAEFLSRFISEILPELVPHLFPYQSTHSWVYDPYYELPQVLEMKKRINDVREAADREAKQLEEQVCTEKENNEWLYEILTGTGDSLKAAVHKALNELGFEKVVDVDKTAEHLDEDLRILDSDHRLLVEVKGINGLPSDDDVQQVAKHVPIRMREWQNNEVSGLTIINHQRKLEPLKRQNRDLIRPQILRSLEHQKLGLLTGWDLFKLVRNFQRNKWHHAEVHNLFYSTGRIHPIPLHYEYIGQIQEYWEKPGAIGFQLKSGELEIADRVAFILPVDYEEQKVTSIQIEGKPVDKVCKGDLVGISTCLSKSQARIGTLIYRIKNGAPNT